MYTQFKFVIFTRMKNNVVGSAQTIRLTVVFSVYRERKEYLNVMRRWIKHKGTCAQQSMKIKQQQQYEPTLFERGGACPGGCHAFKFWREMGDLHILPCKSLWKMIFIDWIYETFALENFHIVISHLYNV